MLVRLPPTSVKEIKLVYSEYKLQRILYHSLQGFKLPTICRLLEQEGLCATRVGNAKFLKEYHETGSIARRPGSGRPSKITAEIKALVEQKMREDDETTAVQLHAMLKDHGTPFPCVQFFAVRHRWVGPLEAVNTVSLFAK